MAAVIIPAPEAPKLFGLSPVVHLQKLLSGLGVTDTVSAGETPPEDAEILLFWNGGAVCSQAMLRHLLERENFLLKDEHGVPLAARVNADHQEATLAWMQNKGEPPQGLEVSVVEDLGTIYNFKLRKAEAPFCEMVTSENRKMMEKTIYLSTYKGVTDLVTKYVWPVPALFLTRFFLKLGWRPNGVTFVGVFFMFAAMYLFWQGSFGLGLVAAWIMAILDTVDGKMARVSLDHGMDLVHPPFWYLAWAIGLSQTDTPLFDGWFKPLIWTIFVTYIVVRLFEGYFIRRFGFHIHVWRRCDSFFRLIVARRNSNLLILMAMWAVGRPDLGVILVAAWQVVALVVHLIQTINAEISVRKGSLRSWMDIEADKAALK